MAAPTLDGTAATGSFSGTSSGTATLTTSNANDVIVVIVGNEEASAPARIVSSVTASGLTFTRRGGLSMPTTGGGQPWNTEVWWAPSTGTLSSEVITVTMTGNVDNAVISAFGVSGCANISSPWDTNGSLPEITSSPTDTINPATPVFSTSEASDFILFFAFSINNANPLTSAWTALAHPSSSGGIFFATTQAYYTTVTSTQTGVSPSITAQSEVGIFYVDALTANTPPIDVDLTSVSSAAAARSVSLAITSTLTATRVTSAALARPVGAGPAPPLGRVTSAAVARAVTGVGGPELSRASSAARALPIASINSSLGLSQVSSAAEARAVTPVSGEFVTLQGVNSGAEARGVITTANPPVVFPIFSIMRSRPVAASGEMDATPIALIGRLLPSGPQPASVQITLARVTSAARVISVSTSRNVSASVSRVTSAGVARGVITLT